MLQAIITHGAKSIADAAKISERHVPDIGKGGIIPSEKTLAKLHSAAKALENASVSEQSLREGITAMMEERKASIRSLAANLEIDPSNLAKILSGHRDAGTQLIHAHEYLMSRTTLAYHEPDVG
ncbi:MAG TPA: hypothetical protein VEF76_08210 [Patescibacteria group bacterium]|nr:hypothetical protein [Patescibacteria group bacterium]